MGNTIKKILDPGGLLGLADEEKPDAPPPEPGPTARRDPIDENSLNAQKDADAAKQRRERVLTQKPVKRATTGLRVNLSSEAPRAGVQTK